MSDLDRKVAQAMGLKSVNNCEEWSNSNMKDPEDEAFEELALKQGQWNHTSGWRKKQIMEQAFPNPHRTDMTGMTLRDYFAAKATEQDIKNYEQDEGKEISGTDSLGHEWKRREIIYYTREQAKYRYADAMLKAREA
jgi:hypothetical protein